MHVGWAVRGWAHGGNQIAALDASYDSTHPPTPFNELGYARSVLPQTLHSGAFPRGEGSLRIPVAAASRPMRCFPLSHLHLGYRRIRSFGAAPPHHRPAPCLSRNAGASPPELLFVTKAPCSAGWEWEDKQTDGGPSRSRPSRPTSFILQVQQRGRRCVCKSPHREASRWSPCARRSDESIPPGRAQAGRTDQLDLF